MQYICILFMVMVYHSILVWLNRIWKCLRSCRRKGSDLRNLWNTSTASLRPGWGDCYAQLCPPASTSLTCLNLFLRKQNQSNNQAPSRQTFKSQAEDLVSSPNGWDATSSQKVFDSKTQKKKTKVLRCKPDWWRDEERPGNALVSCNTNWHLE